MLEQAGVDFEVRSPDFDEDEAKQAHRRRRAKHLRSALAEGKAASIAAGADDWVIGSDSTVTVDGVRYSKPRDRDEAAAHLRAFLRPDHAAVERGRAGQAGPGRMEPCRNRAAPRSGR